MLIESREMTTLDWLVLCTFKKKLWKRCPDSFLQAKWNFGTHSDLSVEIDDIRFPIEKIHVKNTCKNSSSQNG